MVPQIPARAGFFFAVLAAAAGGAAAQPADRPTAMSLFPSETVALVRTADARELVDRLQQTAGVQMLRDPAMAPLVGSLEQSAREAYEQRAREHVQTDLDSLTRLPQGEAAFGVVERDGEAAFGVAAILDFRGEVETATQLFERIQQLVSDRGGVVAEEQLRNDTATTIRRNNDQRDAIGVVRRGEVFVIASDRELLQTILDRWDGIEEPVVTQPRANDAGDAGEEEAEPAGPKYTGILARNAAFAESLQECLRGREGPPQLIGFVDPIGFVRAVAGQQMGTRVALAALPVLGVDGIEGASAAAWLATDTWDNLVRAHLLIDNPRAGVLRVVRLEGGDTTPPPMVPASVAGYTTAKIDAQQVFKEVAQIVDRFRGREGRFQEDAKNGSMEAVGFDFEQQLLPILTGRVSLLSSFDPAATTAAGQTIVVVGVTDEQEARRLLDVAAKKHAETNEKRAFGATEYYASKTPAPPGGENGDDGPSGRPRQPFSPAAGVFGGAIVLSTSEPLMKKMIQTHEGAEPRLRDELQYKLVASRIRRLAGGRDVGVLAYENPQTTLRHWYSIATSAETRERLEGFDNPVGQALRDALDAGELPPVETLLKYAAPSGSLVYDTDNGFHYMAFGFKPAAAQPAPGGASGFGR